MGLFKNIRRALRGGKALPNEHGPAAAIEAARIAMEAAHAGVSTGGKCPVIHDTSGLGSEIGSNPSPEIKFIPATANRNAGCACAGGSKCACGTAKAEPVKVEVKKPAAATKAAPKKPSASSASASKPAAKTTAKTTAKPATTSKSAATAAKKPAPKKK